MDVVFTPEEVTMAQMGRPGLSEAAEARAVGADGKQDKRYALMAARSGQTLRINLWCAVRTEAVSLPRRRAVATLAIYTESAKDCRRDWSQACGLRKIAARLGRAPSTMSREICRNEGRSKYRAANAETSGPGDQACRPKPCRLAVNRSLQMRGGRAEKPVGHWSPQQISGWLKIKIVNDRQ